MPTDNCVRAAKAAGYGGLTDRPVITNQGRPEDGSDCTSTPQTRPSLRSYDTTYPNVGIRDGRATYLSCLQRGYSKDIAQRVVDWEREHPAAVERYPTHDTRLWDAPTSVRARCSGLPLNPSSPLSDSPSPPPRHGLLPRSYEGERQRSRPPIRKFKKLNLRSMTGSPSPRLTSVGANDQCTVQKAEEQTRQHPLSYLTEEFMRDGIARNLAQADCLRSQREKREAEEEKERKQKNVERVKAKREQNSIAEKRLKLEDVPTWLKNLAKSYRERHPGPDKLFRKDFDFGPKTQGDEDDDYRRPLSPFSSGNSFPDSSLESRSRSLKRQRHDSSNADVGTKLLHDQLHSMSSHVPIQRAQPNASAGNPSMRGLGAPDVHPGQCVDFTRSTSPKFDVDRSNRDSLTSDYNCDDIVDYFRTRTCGPVNHVHEHWTGTLSKQEKLKDNTEEDQAAAIRKKTCELKRKPRTTRNRSPVLFEPVSRTRTAEPLISRWSPLMTSITKTNTMQSSASQDERTKRRRSYVARCRSTDAFLRNVRESQKRRQLVRNMEYMGQPRADTPDPRCPKECEDWLGDEPL